MIPVALACALWLPALLGLGAALLAWQRVGDASTPDGAIRLSLCGALGGLAASWLGNAANFFVPLHPYVALATWSIGTGCAWRHRRGLIECTRRLDWPPFALILLLSAAAVASQPLTFDEGLYHLPSIKWLSDSPVPLGLGQLHARLGFNSSWFTLAACLELPLLYGRGLYVGLCLVFVLLGLLVYDGLGRALRGDASVATLVALGSAYPWGLVLLRGWNDPPGTTVWLSLTDAASIYVVLLALVIMLRRPATAASGVTEALALGSVSLLAATGKLSNAALVVGTALLLLRRYLAARRDPATGALLGRALRRSAWVWAAVGVVWTLRGVALTGGVAYPSTIGHFERLPWALSTREIVRMQRIIEGWAQSPAVLPPERAVDRPGWIEPWSRRVGELEVVSVSERLAAGGLALIAVAVLVQMPGRRSGETMRAIVHPDSAIAALTMLAALVHCFVTAPEPRFCLGFLFGLAAWLAASGLRAIQLPDAPRPLVIAVALTITYAGLRGGHVVSPTRELLVPRWPAVPAPPLEARRTNDGLVVYVGELPYLGPIPNTPYLGRRLKMRIGTWGLPDMFWYNVSDRRRPGSPVRPEEAPDPPATAR